MLLTPPSRHIRHLPIVVGLLGLVPGLTGCESLRYLSSQGLGQLQLLRQRRHVSDVLLDPATSPALRRRLRLVMKARRFGVTELGLRGDAEFTLYVDNGDAVAYNLSAAYQSRLLLRSWRFPLVGRVPYLGFFTHAAAQTEARRLEAAGFDTYIRPVGAYSTLGLLISPIYRSMIDQAGTRGDVRSVETILHEMAHSTAWLQGASDLNESFATVVGNKGAALFFAQHRDKGGGGTDGARRADELARADDRRGKDFANWLRGALKKLDVFYKDAAKLSLPRDELLRRREEVFTAIKDDYRKTFPTGGYRVLARGPLNNAVLLSMGVYALGRGTEDKGRRRPGLSGEKLQRALLSAVHGDLGAYISLYRRAARRSDGAAWLRQIVPSAPILKAQPK